MFQNIQKQKKINLSRVFVREIQVSSDIHDNDAVENLVGLAGGVDIDLNANRLDAGAPLLEPLRRHSGATTNIHQAAVRQWKQGLDFAPQNIVVASQIGHSRPFSEVAETSLRALLAMTITRKGEMI